MDRRSVLVAGGAFVGALLGGGAAHAAVQWPMFEWEVPGGFHPPGVGVMVPPLLAVYGDGEAYADAVAHQYLTGQQARSLQDHAVRVLRNRANTRRLPGREAPQDAPSDRVRGRTTDGRNLTGLALREEGNILVLADAQGKEVRVPLDEIEERIDRYAANPHPDPVRVAAE